MRTSPCIAVLAFLAGCNPPARSQVHNDSAPSDVGFQTDDGFPLPRRRLDAEFSTDVNQLLTGPDGTLWVLRTSLDGPSRRSGEDPTETVVLERYSQEGRYLGTAVTLRDTVLSTHAPEACVHPSGEVTLAYQAKSVTKQPSAHLVLLRLAPDGTQLARAILDDYGRMQERVFYKVADTVGVGKVIVEKSAYEVETAEGHAVYPGWGHTRCEAAGEDAVVFAWTVGTKLYRLAPDLTRRWDTVVMPHHSGRDYEKRALLSVDRDGAITVVQRADDGSVLVNGDYFGRPLPRVAGVSDALVTRFDGAGKRLAEGLFGGPEGDTPVGVFTRGSDVSLLANSRRAKFDRPNDTTEWDLVLVRGTLDDPGRSTVVPIDIAREDIAHAALAQDDGGFVVAGVTDFLQVDTNSYVENGKGFVARIDPEGTVKALRIIEGPRHTSVSAIAPSKDGGWIVGGTTDGPITHTGDSDESLTYDEGFLSPIPASL